MKTLLSLILFLSSCSLFAQDLTKDSTQSHDYGARIYDVRIRSYVGTDKQRTNNNPYQFADTVKQVADKPKKNQIKESLNSY